MALTRAEKMVSRLQNMQAAVPDIEASAVVSVDGLIIAYVVLTAVGEEAVLTVLARKEAKLGLIFLEMRRAATDLGNML